MPDLRERLLALCGPGQFSGITLGDWLGLLVSNGFRVGPRYWPRAAFVTLRSMMVTPLRRLDDILFGGKVAHTPVQAPLFILGHWRSGTTLLYNLLSQDTRFAYPNFYQVMHPHHFLCMERVETILSSSKLLPGTRAIDNMKLGFDSPQEDEFALCVATGMSPYMSWSFPRRADHYDRYLTFQDVQAGEVACWQRSLLHLARKLSYKHGGRPLVFKSPTHTARIRMLLSLFPDARFVHIHRHPHRVYPSTLHMNLGVARFFQMQDLSKEWLQERILRQYAQMHEAYFAQRGLIPVGRLHEVRFDDLEQNPVGQLRTLYERLGLPDFAAVEPDVQRFVASLSSYCKNSYPELPLPLRARLDREWRPAFERWGYNVSSQSSAVSRSGFSYY